jgi:hypothetical protein
MYQKKFSFILFEIFHFNCHCANGRVKKHENVSNNKQRTPLTKKKEKEEKNYL